MLKSINPATGEEVALHAEHGAAEIEARLAAAVDAFQAWRKSRPAERAALLSRMADVYDSNKAALARMASLEMGKTYKSAVAEVEKCARAFHYYAERGEAMLDRREQCLGDGSTGELRWQPLGPILAVMPWNFPYWQVVRFLAPAIMAGNVGLLKHASNVQGVAALMEEMAREAGAPHGLFQNLAIGSDTVGEIIADSRVAGVTLTGSEGAGASVAAQAGRFLKPSVLELGGSDPFIVMPSADLDTAVSEAVRARIQNSGQSCICAKRMIVHEEIWDAFLERFTAAMLRVKAGDPFDEASDMGPLSSAGQRDTVLEQLARAKESGATLVGGEAPDGPGAFLSAGVLTNVPLDSDLAAEELFGPVAMVFRAGDVEEAIRIANATSFGLGSSVWTADEVEQERFADGLEAGMVAINRMLASSPEVPFGGVKRSGYGRELGEFGMHEFMNLKTILRPAG